MKTGDSRKITTHGNPEMGGGTYGIIHPVGEQVNVFRPMSDLPTVEQLIEGLKAYIVQAREFGYRVYVGTLLPMGGWRTDAPFRQEMRHAYNAFIRTIGGHFVGKPLFA